MKKILLTMGAVFLVLFSTSFAQSSECCIDVDYSSNQQVKEDEILGLYLNVEPKVAYNLIKNKVAGAKVIIIDVRTPKEFLQEHLKGALNINYYDKSFKQKIDELEKDATYILICRSGNRSSSAIKLMEELNFSSVYNVLGGMNKWVKEKLPVVK